MKNFHKVTISSPSQNWSHPDWEKELQETQPLEEDSTDLFAEIDALFGDEYDSDDKKCGAELA